MNPARVVMYDKFASYSTFDCIARYTLLTWATELGSFVSALVVFPPSAPHHVTAVKLVHSPRAGAPATRTRQRPKRT